MKGCIDKYFTKGSCKPHWRYRIYRGKDAAGKKQFVIKAGFKKQGEAEDAMRAAMAKLEAKDRMAPVPKKTLASGCGPGSKPTPLTVASPRRWSATSSLPGTA